MSITETRRPARRSRRRRLSPLALRKQHRRRSHKTVITADVALHALMSDGDLFKIGRHHYLVAPVPAQLLDILIEAMGRTEDAEDNGDTEPSIGSYPATGLHLAVDDLEGDEGDGTEGSLGWANEGSQERLHTNPSGEEDEPELGWSNTGGQLNLSEGYTQGDLREGDDNCDDEDGDPSGDPLDRGEFDPLDLGEHDDCDDEYSYRLPQVLRPGDHMPPAYVPPPMQPVEVFIVPEHVGPPMKPLGEPIVVEEPVQ